MKCVTLFELLLGLLILFCANGCKDQKEVRELFNVSYDPTRELYEEYNQEFAQYWLDKTGETINVQKSNAGSGGQSRAVQSGFQADVVTLALAFDIDDIAKEKNGHPGLLSAEWQKRLPNNSCPYYSTIVILVRKGNPKNIKDWDDLIKDDVKVITPNPKTSGGARWNYLAIWGAILDRELASIGGLSALNDPAKAEAVKAANAKAYDFTKKVFANAVAQGMPTGARDATDDFVKRGNGDAFLAWENEAILSQKVKAEEGFEIVLPKVSIKAEPPVAVLDQLVDARGTRDIAEEYLRHLYDPDSQEMIARNNYRPNDSKVAEKFKEKFPTIKMFTINDVFGSWGKAQAEHFNSNGQFDQMLLEISKEKK